MSYRVRCVALISGVALAVGSAQAFVPWSNPNGSGNFFDWANGGSDNGLYGDPTLVNGDTFVFFPQQFRAESSDGVSDVINDRLQFELIAHTNFMFTGIEINEFGDYGVFNEGQVSAEASLFVTDLNLFRVEQDNMVTTPPSPITSGAGDWTGHAFADLTKDPPEWTRIMVVLDNNLVAISVPGSSTYIEKKVLGGGVYIRIIPAPGTLGIATLGLLALSRRRR